MPITEFWEITPFELELSIEGYRQRMEIANKQDIYQAYLISRWVWQKRIDIEKILKPQKKKEVMSDEEMLERVKTLNAIFGGEVRKDEQK